jgi:hypothetical protein
MFAYRELKNFLDSIQDKNNNKIMGYGIANAIKIRVFNHEEREGRRYGNNFLFFSSCSLRPSWLISSLVP